MALRYPKVGMVLALKPEYENTYEGSYLGDGCEKLIIKSVGGTRCSEYYGITDIDVRILNMFGQDAGLWGWIRLLDWYYIA